MYHHKDKKHNHPKKYNDRKQDRGDSDTESSCDCAKSYEVRRNDTEHKIIDLYHEKRNAVVHITVQFVEIGEDPFFATGSGFLILADLISRTIISPTELPIGVITALIGAPVFALILLQRKRMERSG